MTRFEWQNSTSRSMRGNVTLWSKTQRLLSKRKIKRRLLYWWRRKRWSRRKSPNLKVCRWCLNNRNCNLKAIWTTNMCSKRWTKRQRQLNSSRKNLTSINLKTLERNLKSSKINKQKFTISSMISLNRMVRMSKTISTRLKLNSLRIKWRTSVQCQSKEGDQKLRIELKKKLQRRRKKTY